MEKKNQCELNKLFLSNHKLETLNPAEKREYFSKLKDYCLKLKPADKNKQNIYHKIISTIIPNLRTYEYEIIGAENIPDNGKALFVCNHSNSHDFFTALEIFKKLGSNVSVFAASDDLNPVIQFVFKSCKAVLIDRNDKEDIEEGIFDFSANLINEIPGVIFGEATWNLHPYKPMQKIKIGGVNIAAISEVPIIPTIFEYYEVPQICSKESNLYSKCFIKFGKPINISREESLISQTFIVQSSMEQLRLNLWNQLGIMKKSLADINQDIYLNHTYLKKFDAFGCNYDSKSEAKYLFSKDGHKVENEFHLDQNGNFVPGITEKGQGRIYRKNCN